MEIISNKKEMIFLNEYNGKEIYSIGLSKKDMNGNYVNGYINCRFKKDVHLKNKTLINIKNAWLDFYISQDKKTIPYIFINEFEIIEENNNIEENKEVVKDPYEQMGDEVALSEDELPF